MDKSSISDSHKLEEIEKLKGKINFEDPPFPWDENKIDKSLERSAFNYHALRWVQKKEIRGMFNGDNYSFFSWDIGLLEKYLENNKEKFKRWHKEYDTIQFRMHSVYQVGTYIVGIRKETDEEYNERVKKIIEKRDRRRRISSENKKKKQEDRERILFEKLKKKFEKN